MKKFVLAVAIALLTGIGCTVEKPQTQGTPSISSERQAQQSQRVLLADDSFELEFPAGWYANDREHPFDLQYFAPKQNMNTGVFVYATEDLASGSTPLDILKVQISDIQSKRTNFVVVEPNATENLEDKTLTTSVHSGEKNGLKNYYKFTLVEFVENPVQFLVILQIAFPSEWRKSKPILEGITRSVRIRSVGQ